MKLHLGCGDKRLKEYINIDWRKTAATDLVHDLNKNLPYPNNSIQLIETYHLIEHLSKNGAIRLLRECFRTLIPKTKIIIECPDLDQAMREYLGGNENRLLNIFGRQRFPGDAHLWGYNFDRLKRQLKKIGFRNIENKKARDYHTKSEPCLRVEMMK